LFNVADMVVGVVVGAAFPSVVGAFAKDLLRPLITEVIGKPDFSSISFSAAFSPWVIFINALVSFLLVAAAV